MGFSTTPKTNGNPGTDSGAGVPDKTQPTLQDYLTKVYNNVKSTTTTLGPDFGVKTHISISIFLQGKPGHPHVYAGIFDTEHQFSGSLLKVAAMFAAFKLKKEANLLIDKIKAGTVISTNVTDFFKKLDAQFDVTKAVPGIATNNAVNKRPKYTEILSVTGFPTASALAVDFTAAWKDHMRKMIVPSDNCHAGECIVTLGYPYINVKLMEDGFFVGPTWNTASPVGAWLAGDYILPICFNKDKKQQYIRITTTNDCDAVTHFCGSAQNTTSKEMAQFFLKILQRELVDPDSSDKMFDLLVDAQNGIDSSFVSRVLTPTSPFIVMACKIGQGPIKSDPDRGNIEVRSEGIIIEWGTLDPAVKKKWDDLNLTSDAAICWQNLPNTHSAAGIERIIRETITAFINKDPI